MDLERAAAQNGADQRKLKNRLPVAEMSRRRGFHFPRG
jgi:hypothetical protein